MSERIADVSRNTLETQISIKLNIDGTGQSTF
ncbi:MAG: imidazoleglycerol-phosphate dehydratase, partial [Gammaproteobacteria bacterium]|nr:imidazoleglycerol-phosphate dehydratase [Gammaproteobacteria bacterium]MDX2486778.1 imidazoleglycerol-phosphate dehydratase [Gammaproteobacteria bacterium]